MLCVYTNKYTILFSLKIQVEGLRSYNYILVPVVANSHWTLGVSWSAFKVVWTMIYQVDSFIWFGDVDY